LLRNDLYTVTDLEYTGNNLVCRLSFNAAHDIFKGHFPGQPVVPGVCTMEAVKELLELQLQQRIMLESAGNVKFLQLITPDLQPMAKITYTQVDGTLQVSATLLNNDIVLFKMTASYKVHE
jgi:3-hydroxyacyl-[acyl-carrier-protein] dehydratase